MLAAVEDEEKVKGFNAIFSLLVLFLSPLTFSRGVLCSMDSMRALEGGQGKVGEILLGPPTGHMNKPTPHSVTHCNKAMSGAGI
jgi:hypothetical protein